MTLEEFYEKVGGDYADVCDRLGGPEVVGPIVKMLETDRHYDRCKKALLTGDMSAAFCAVHALKGICLNLDIRNIQKNAAVLTDLLRAPDPDMEKVPSAFSALQSSYLDTIDALKELKLNEE